MDPYFLPTSLFFFSSEHVAYIVHSYISKTAPNEFYFPAFLAHFSTIPSSLELGLLADTTGSSVGSSTSVVQISSSSLTLSSLELPANSDSFCPTSPSFPFHVQFLCSFSLSRLTINPLPLLIKPQPSCPQLRADQSSGTLLSTGVQAEFYLG